MQTIRQHFESFMCACYGDDWEEKCTQGQILNLEDAYYAGAQTFMLGFMSSDPVVVLHYELELKDFGTRIEQRYKDADLLKKPH